MNPDLLSAFLAVTKHLNYTLAARELFLTQPAVSRRVRQLEDELGVKLFERIGNSLRPTDAGEVFAVEATKVLGSIERAKELLQEHLSPDQGRLRIGASTTPGLYLLPPLVRIFHDEHPEVELTYEVENSRDIEQMVIRNRIDVGFIGSAPTSKDLEATTLLRDEIVCFAIPGHRLAAPGGIDPRDLRDECWVFRERGSATRDLFESWIESRGVTLRRVLEVRSPDVVKALVATGIGISAMSIEGLRTDFETGRFVMLPVRNMKVGRPIRTIVHQDKIVAPVLRAFLDIVNRKLASRRRPPRGGEPSRRSSPR